MLNEKIIAIDKGRDAGKTFKGKEMPVTKLEKRAARALLAVFGLSDAYEMLEIIAVDGHNQRLWSKFHERR